MDTDLAFVFSLLLGLASLPSFANAYSEWRFPRLALALVGLSAGLMVFAVRNGPGYTIAGIPDVFVRVVARLVN
jgi:hypothetical protein